MTEHDILDFLNSQELEWQGFDERLQVDWVGEVNADLVLTRNIEQVPHNT